ncbi:hypothetical protein F2Q70_00039381 [Brassica cretica]|uniref:CCHC-type domain-containing protein n=1 Tax=Brassica cretica TaxID=69181 RepID=A0A8S9K857_BRACR|nr:hypothetical protein F2Q70_00039381 [Brassica cretica]
MGHLYRDRGTDADLIEREISSWKSSWVVLKQWLKYLMEERNKRKAIMLNADQYGHWKAHVKQLIRGINEDAWTSVEIDAIGMLIKNFGKTNHSGGRNQYDRSRGGRDSSRRREGLKCYECEGVGHIRADCPVAQRRETKCPGCREGSCESSDSDDDTDDGKYHVLLNKLKDRSQGLEDLAQKQKELLEVMYEELVAV